MGTIGIIGAMEVEVKELKEQMQITRQLTKAGMEFCEGILEGQDVVVVRSGVGCKSSDQYRNRRFSESGDQHR